MKGIAIASFDNGDNIYNTLTKICIRKIREFSNLPIFLCTNSNIDFNVDYRLQYEFLAKNKIRNLITPDGYKQLSFENDIKFYTSLMSPFENTIQIDVDYILNSNNIDKLIDYPDLCFIKKHKFIGTECADSNLIYSWVFKYNKNKEFFKKAINMHNEYMFTDRILFELSKEYNFNYWTDAFYSLGYTEKFNPDIHIIDDRDIHIPDKKRLILNYS